MRRCLVAPVVWLALVVAGCPGDRTRLVVRVVGDATSVQSMLVTVSDADGSDMVPIVRDDGAPISLPTSFGLLLSNPTAGDASVCVDADLGGGAMASGCTDFELVPGTDLEVVVDLGGECGNGLCDGLETCTLCPADCGQCCGDGDCDGAAGESCDTCPADCGMCCGDAFCDTALGETCALCIVDCGALPLLRKRHLRHRRRLHLVHDGLRRLLR